MTDIWRKKNEREREVGREREDGVFVWVKVWERKGEWARKAAVGGWLVKLQVRQRWDPSFSGGIRLMLVGANANESIHQAASVCVIENRAGMFNDSGNWAGKRKRTYILCIIKEIKCKFWMCWNCSLALYIIILNDRVGVMWEAVGDELP